MTISNPSSLDPFTFGDSEACKTLAKILNNKNLYPDRYQVRKLTSFVNSGIYALKYTSTITDDKIRARAMKAIRKELLDEVDRKRTNWRYNDEAWTYMRNVFCFYHNLYSETPFKDSKLKKKLFKLIFGD
jgi:hypothetical protein